MQDSLHKCPDTDEDTFTVALSGDVMLTRRVSECREPAFLKLVQALRDADATCVNLETCVRWWEEGTPSITTGTPMTTTPDLLSELRWLGVDVVTCANNHVYDYGENGVLAMLRHLRDAGIPQAGCGRNLYEARLPAYAETARGRVGFVAMTSTFRPWNAASNSRGEVAGRPGVNPLRHTAQHHVDSDCFDALLRMSRGLGFAKEQERARTHFFSDKEIGCETTDVMTLFGQTICRSDRFETLTETPEAELDAQRRWIAEARGQCDILVVSLHTHEFAGRSLKKESLKVNLSEPADFIRQAAHAAIDAGADIVAGHGSHTALGVEIYKGRPIFYSLGGLIFQNETLPFVPAEAYERFDLGPDATPSNLFDARTKHDTKGFPAYAGYWECFVPVCHFKQGQLASIDIIPTDLGYGQPRHRRGRAMWADGAQAAKILSRVAALSKDLGPRVEISGGVGRIEL